MKTAMQELIDDFQSELDTNRLDKEESFVMKWTIYRATHKLEKEKEQIVNAFEIGYKSCDMDEAFEINRKLASGEQYFNKTYK